MRCAGVMARVRVRVRVRDGTRAGVDGPRAQVVLKTSLLTVSMTILTVTLLLWLYLRWLVLLGVDGPRAQDGGRRQGAHRQDA